MFKKVKFTKIINNFYSSGANESRYFQMKWNEPSLVDVLL